MADENQIQAIKDKGRPTDMAATYNKLMTESMADPHTGEKKVWKPGKGFVKVDDPQDKLSAATGMVGPDGKPMVGPNQIAAPSATQEQNQQSMGQKSRQQATDEINLQIPASRNANFRPALNLFPDVAPQELTLEERLANQNARRLDAGAQRVGIDTNTDHMKEAIKNVAMDKNAYGDTTESLKNMSNHTKTDVPQ